MKQKLNTSAKGLRLSLSESVFLLSFVTTDKRKSPSGSSATQVKGKQDIKVKKMKPPLFCKHRASLERGGGGVAVGGVAPAA